MCRLSRKRLGVSQPMSCCFPQRLRAAGAWGSGEDAQRGPGHRHPLQGLGGRGMTLLPSGSPAAAAATAHRHSLSRMGERKGIRVSVSAEQPTLWVRLALASHSGVFCLLSPSN